jgi:hypothetical protein
VTTGRRHLSPADFTPVVRAAFGDDRELVRVERLAGGSRKGVYRLSLTGESGPPDAGSVVAYVWNDNENYWPVDDHPSADDQTPDSGFDRFVQAHDALDDAGVPVSTVHFLDQRQGLIAGDLAVVEDLTGGTLYLSLVAGPLRLLDRDFPRRRDAGHRRAEHPPDARPALSHDPPDSRDAARLRPSSRRITTRGFPPLRPVVGAATSKPTDSNNRRVPT